MLYDPERHWVRDAACRGQPLARFFSDGPRLPGTPPSAETQAGWDKVKQICHGCPVMQQCRRDTLGEPYGIWGGYDQYQRFLIRQALPKAARRWPVARRRRWAAVVWGLHQRGAPWHEIQRRTGIPTTLGLVLQREHLARLTAQRAAEAARKAKIVSLTEPRAKRAFPAGRGRRDMWVRHNGAVVDAFYKGETADGVWIRAHLPVGRGHALKWIPATDVRFHARVPKYTEQYEGRPDGPTRYERRRAREPAA